GTGAAIGDGRVKGLGPRQGRVPTRPAERRGIPRFQPIGPQKYTRKHTDFMDTPAPPPPLAGSILDVIGNTPLVELRRCAAIGHGPNGRLLAKLETSNPGASKKDRIALEIIREARA